MTDFIYISFTLSNLGLVGCICCYLIIFHYSTNADFLDLWFFVNCGR